MPTGPSTYSERLTTRQPRLLRPNQTLLNTLLNIPLQPFPLVSHILLAPLLRRTGIISRSASSPLRRTLYLVRLFRNRCTVTDDVAVPSALEFSIRKQLFGRVVVARAAAAHVGVGAVLFGVEIVAWVDYAGARSDRWVGAAVCC